MCYLGLYELVLETSDGHHGRLTGRLLRLLRKTMVRMKMKDEELI